MAETARNPAPAAHRKGLSVFLTLIVIALLAGGAWWLVQRSKAPAAASSGFGMGRGGPPGGSGGDGPSVAVGSVVALQGALPIVVDALGTVTPPITSTLVPQVSGVLTEVLFTEGQMVKKGQVLARIDVRPYEQALAQARGQKARDEAQLTAAKLMLSRYQQLLTQDSIARQDVDTQAALVKQLEGAVESDSASVRSAELNVGFATIRAPISGRIGLRAIDPGNLVTSGTAGGIATIMQVAPIDVLFSVPQERLGAVQAAYKSGKLPVAALDRARTQPLAQGQFLTLDNVVNAATGTVRAKARFTNADGALFPGQFVNARLQLGQDAGVLVPVTAVRTGPQGDYVYVIDAEQTAHTRAVTKGLANAEQILITQGLKAGERVVSEGGDRVKDGGKVRLADESKKAPEPSGQAQAATETKAPDLSRLSPELREKVEKMTPEERRAFFAQRRGPQGTAQ